MGEVLRIPYEAPQGRRVNVIGAYCSHGVLSGEFAFESFASLPKQKGKTKRKSLSEMAASHGLSEEYLGPIDGRRFLAFVWRLSGRPADADANWRRERLLVIVLDNYSVHKGQLVKEALPALEAANIRLFYLPSYSPELSEIEPIWRSVKGHGMPYRTETQLGRRKQAVDQALTQKARELKERASKTTHIECAST